MFRRTLVVKIKKTQESTPSFLKKKLTEDKENMLLPQDYFYLLNRASLPWRFVI